MLFNPFKKSVNKKRVTLERVLQQLADMSPSSANCSIVKTREGQEVDESLGRAFIFKHGPNQHILTQNKAIYLSTPDGIKAEDKSLFTGKDEIVHLWFLYRRIPYTIDCRVMGRVRFTQDILDDLTPRLPLAYMLRPVGTIHKDDKRTFLRFLHKSDDSDRRVYGQIRFDLFATRTNLTFPESGSLPNYLNDLKLSPYNESGSVPDQSPEEMVNFMKNAIRLNPRESRVVHVSKPFMDERTNKVSLLDLDQADVLGLETSHDNSRTFYVRKPIRMSKNRRDPTSLKEGDIVVLGFHTRVSLEAPAEYYDTVCEIVRVGTETVTMRSIGILRLESGIPLELIDFSVGGVKVEGTDSFLRYILGEDHRNIRLQEKIQTLESLGFLLNFYPKLRFNRETEIYAPTLPMRIQILAKIVWVETTRSRDEESPEIAGFGMKFYYDPIEYSRDTYSYDRWELIRDFRENRHFREIHTSLNNLIAFIESQRR